MGTKIEYSINPLAYLGDCNNFTLSGVDAREHYQNKEAKVINNHCSIGVNSLKNPMDRKLNRNNIESIKKTMQMHEDIFKNQVKELHRVYNVQKMLMDEHKNQTKQNKFWTPMNGTTIGINQPYFVQQPTQISFSHVQILKEDLMIKERSGSNSGDIIIKKREIDFDLEKPARSDCDEEDMEVDLTLCIGGSNQTKNKKKKSYNLLPLPNSYVSFQSDRIGDCSDPTTPMSSSSVTFDQDKKVPHWFSQGLKLK
ncbi:uncharacterized protein LOC131629825 [Vicia villosa]|uniref:uncharacterized protein LOC131629825 n=1 Tax=Vicia villosa TaxID=3911 RepID=UPI00273C160B|nr:uncharacterized protein LOC131629825 [Vicia villosa]